MNGRTQQEEMSLHRMLARRRQARAALADCRERVGILEERRELSPLESLRRLALELQLKKLRQHIRMLEAELNEGELK